MITTIQQYEDFKTQADLASPAALNDNVNPETAIANFAMSEKISCLRNARNDRLKLQALEKQLQKEIKDYIGDAQTLEDETGILLCTYKYQKPTQKFDSTKFKAEHADMYNAYLCVSTQRKFLLK